LKKFSEKIKNIFIEIAKKSINMGFLKKKIGQKRAGMAKSILKRIKCEIQIIQNKKEIKSFKKT
jgi:hypothetical protein